jgi:hypothetical protein
VFLIDRALANQLWMQKHSTRSKEEKSPKECFPGVGSLVQRPAGSVCRDAFLVLFALKLLPPQPLTVWR